MHASYHSSSTTTTAMLSEPRPVRRVPRRHVSKNSAQTAEVGAAEPRRERTARTSAMACSLVTVSHTPSVARTSTSPGNRPAATRVSGTPESTWSAAGRWLSALYFRLPRAREHASAPLSRPRASTFEKGLSARSTRRFSLAMAGRWSVVSSTATAASPPLSSICRPRTHRQVPALATYTAISPAVLRRTTAASAAAPHSVASTPRAASESSGGNCWARQAPSSSSPTPWPGVLTGLWCECLGEGFRARTRSLPTEVMGPMTVASAAITAAQEVASKRDFTCNPEARSRSRAAIEATKPPAMSAASVAVRER
mmetsp:Transcript_15788/g.42455  ORF Transcript_15788/g.42455 Transcript_15788/m.42455 type:complete len:312 (-) Transcript_15788:814-1749(-)